MPECLQCQFCDGHDLVYELGTDRGVQVVCIPCLCVKRAQPGVSWSGFQNYDENLQQSVIRQTNDWLRVLARIRQDDPILKRDNEAINSVSEDTRTFLTNVMGSDVYRRPSELTGGEDGA